MENKLYIGARYVTKVYENSQTPGSAEWEAGVIYEPITMVTYQNSTYLSKKEVPDFIGDPEHNPDYWVITGAYNGQISDLQSEIDTLDARCNVFKGSINNTFVLFDQRTHSFAVTGNNWKEALEAMASHILAFIQGTSDDAYIEICDLSCTGIGLQFIIPQHKLYHNTDTAVTFPFFGSQASQSSCYFYTGIAWSGVVNNNKLVRTTLRDNQYPVSEIVDFTSLAPGASFNFNMRIWKKIIILQ